ncbi:hypothetical protein [Paenibacillus sp.]|uniref:Gfo/Idh/MocA family protein n=1 Tax=Paenibacillus sp. TaxID=58172 RepID=UPI002810DB6B|nr:hypothetical protein [Paenibacillus sp.]
MNVDEAEEMERLAAERGLLLGCCAVRHKGKGMLHNEAVKRAVQSGVLGEIYHATFVNKWERSRAGIEYQPQSRWFLERARSGGGIAMDWGPYDISTLVDVLSPSSIDIAAAWTAKPETAADPTDVVYDVEHHIGAFLSFRRNGARAVAVHYERGTCTHGQETFLGEIEGTRGAVHWTPYDSRQPVVLRTDRDGKVVEEVVDPGPRGPFTVMDLPLVHFYNRIRGLPSLANVNGRALDHYRFIRSLYDCAETGERRTIGIEEA